MTAAPATAATPMLAKFMRAAPVDDEPAAVLVAEAEALEAEEAFDALEADDSDDDVAALLVEAAEDDETAAEVETTEALLTMLLGATLALEAPAPVLARVEDADALPEADAVKQPEEPGLTVNAAEFATVPVLSRIASPMEVPDAILVDQVYEVPVWVPRLSRAAAPG